MFDFLKSILKLVWTMPDWSVSKKLNYSCFEKKKSHSLSLLKHMVIMISLTFYMKFKLKFQM